MDCHVFRRLSDELVKILPGLKLEKIHEPILQPHLGLSLFSLYGQGKRSFLFLKFGREPYLFLADHKVTVDKAPAARTMRLRKYLSNARIHQVIPDWLNRTLTLSFNLPVPVFLRLSLRQGPELLFEPPPPALEPIWTTASQALANPQDYPWLTPPLRKTLPLLDTLDQDALLMDLEAGNGDLFVYTDPASSKSAELPHPVNPQPSGILSDIAPHPSVSLSEVAPHLPVSLREVAPHPSVSLSEAVKPQILAWPLPKALLLIGKPTSAAIQQASSGDLRVRIYQEQVIENAVQACQIPATKLVLDYLAESNHVQTKKTEHTEQNRLQKLLLKLETEGDRLQQMVALKASALALQANLYHLDSSSKLDKLKLATASGDLEVKLDPRYTLAENMAKFFHTATRGQRGLSLLTERKKQVQRQLQDNNISSQRAQVLPVKSKLQTLPKNIELIVSVDNFNLLRGKDAKGNASLLKLGSNHDFWLHVEGGPGAHVLIRRNHPSHEVPATTIQQAAQLAKAKSWEKESQQAEVTMALLKHIKPLKTSTGAVKIEKVLEMVVVRDQD